MFLWTFQLTVRLSIETSSPEKKEAFYSMSNAYPDEFPASAGIYMTNSFEMPTYDNEDDDEATTQNVCGMFLAIGRLNHSCVPNAQQTYIPSERLVGRNESENAVGYEVLYATRDINVGEELCDCYIELRQTTEQRRKELLTHYQFICTCPACGPAPEEGTEAAGMTADKLAAQRESDLRRKRALKLDHDMIEFVNMGENSMAIDLGIELVKLLEHEKSQGWGERYIAEACVNTSVLMQEERQLKNALLYLQKGHSWNVRLQGPNSADSKNTARKISELQHLLLNRRKP